MPAPRTVRAALAVAAAGALLAACGGAGDRDPEELQADLAEELQQSPLALGEDEADCYAGVLVDEIGADRLEDVDLSEEEPPAELAEDLAAAALDAQERCDLSAG